MSRTKSFICSSASAGGLMTRSMPSPSTFRSKSVTSAATSMSASAPEVEAGHLTVDPDESFVHDRPPYFRARCRRTLRRRSADRPRVGVVKEWLGLARAARDRRRVDRRRRRSSCPTRPQSVRAVRAYQLLPGVGGAARSATCCRWSRSSSGSRLVLGLLTRAGRGGLRGPVRAVHRRHRLRVGARHQHRLRLLRRRGLRPGRLVDVPLGDRPRRRRCCSLSLFLVWAAAHAAGPGLLLFRPTRRARRIRDVEEEPRDVRAPSGRPPRDRAAAPGAAPPQPDDRRRRRRCCS